MEEYLKLSNNDLEHIRKISFCLTNIEELHSCITYVHGRYIKEINECKYPILTKEESEKMGISKHGKLACLLAEYKQLVLKDAEQGERT